MSFSFGALETIGLRELESKRRLPSDLPIVPPSATSASSETRHVIDHLQFRDPGRVFITTIFANCFHSPPTPSLNGCKMPCLRGIEVSLTTKPDNEQIPEYPHPEGTSARLLGALSSCTNGQPVHRKAGPTVAVYIPSIPGRFPRPDQHVHRSVSV